MGAVDDGAHDRIIGGIPGAGDQNQQPGGTRSDAKDLGVEKQQISGDACDQEVQAGFTDAVTQSGSQIKLA